MQPRWYQTKTIRDVSQAWANGATNVLAVLPPRAGKMLTGIWLSEPTLQAGRGVLFQVHRQELIKQISLEYASLGHQHQIFAPDDVIGNIITSHIKQFGRSYVSPNALAVVGSVDTINARVDRLSQWAANVGLHITDEAHHLLPDNKWGKVIKLFKGARGLGLTATPVRADNKSLGQIFDTIVVGPTARDLINQGFICDYRIIAPPSSIDRDKIKVGSTGDFTQRGLTEAQEKSTITGDCVATYQKYTPNEQAIVFAVNIEHAREMERAFTAQGVSATSVSSKTPSHVRKLIMDKFERGVIRVLINVDLLGEGLNVKGISTVVMARPTKSFGLYVQQFFRALTKADGKGKATIIDHAGNVGYFGKYYGLPDSYSNWSLDVRPTRKIERDEGVIPITTCRSCFQPYERIHKKCPHCGAERAPVERSTPEAVEGDLEEIDEATLTALRGEISRIDRQATMVPAHLRGTPAAIAISKKHIQRQAAQKELRRVIALWAGIWRDKGEDDSMIARRFYFTFNLDLLTAQTLNTRDAEYLTEKVKRSWSKII